MKMFSRFSLRDGKEPVTVVWPDSCMLLSDRPLYVPDFAPDFVALPMAAYKGCRLGKNIAPRFAGRYLAEFTAALCVMPLRAFESVARGESPAGSDLCFDHAVVIGDWKYRCPGRFVITADGLCTGNFEAPRPSEGIAAEALATFSQTNTIKMGDVLMVPLPLNPMPVDEGSRISILDPDTNDTLLITRFK